MYEKTRLAKNTILLFRHLEVLFLAVSSPDSDSTPPITPISMKQAKETEKTDPNAPRAKFRQLRKSALFPSIVWDD